MAHDVRPLTPDDLPALRAFLTSGFHAPDDAAFAALDVLRWKYFDDRGPDAGPAPRSLLAVDRDTDHIVGHVGVCNGRFRGGGLPEDGVSTLHMIDWLSVAPGAGASLMRRAHGSTQTQYGFGGSDAGRGVIGKGGYTLAGLVPVHQRVLRPLHRLKGPGVARFARAAKDLAGLLRRPARRAGAGVDLHPVGHFGSEVHAWLDAYRPRALFTTRDPAFLNHLLRHPRGVMTGWHVEHRGRAVGYALLAVVSQGTLTVGRIADLLLAESSPDLWHASAAALTAELRRRGADVAQAFASNPWTADALKLAGYAPLHPLEFRLRDRSRVMPGSPFHLTPIEADYAYT